MVFEAYAIIEEHLLLSTDIFAFDKNYELSPVIDAFRLEIALITVVGILDPHSIHWYSIEFECSGSTFLTELKSCLLGPTDDAS